MKRSSTILLKFSVLIVLVLFLFNGWAYEGEPLQAKRSPKVESFLKFIMQASSLNNIGKQFKEAKFSAKEKKDLEKELRKQPYSSKLDRLKKQAKASIQPYSEAKMKRKTLQMQQELKQKQAQQLNNLNQKARQFLSTARREARASTDNSSSSMNRLTSQMRTAMLSSPSDSIPSSTIRSITPGSAIIGRDITITGEGFGDIKRRVTIIIGDHYLWFQEISLWTDTVIVARIPYRRESGGVRYAGVERYVGDTPKRAIIWVQPNMISGPSKEITVSPDPATLEPRITSFSNDEVRPGMFLTIWGEQFLEEHEGSVRFRYDCGPGATCTFDGIIREWHDSYVYLEIPTSYRWRIPHGTVRLTLINHVHRSDARSIAFQPILVIREVYRVSHSVNSPFIIGHRDTHTDHNFRLINDYVVESYELDHSGGGIGYGANYLSRPIRGSTNASSRIEIWADLFSDCRSYNYLWVRGPEGRPYR